jgi:16S rRNA A1518/A1519 N6-dimethyltransferase RsmA/KsgA/DIM1 with predicted DNA glycosylase/AP lyase activity
MDKNEDLIIKNYTEWFKINKLPSLRNKNFPPTPETDSVLIMINFSRYINEYTNSEAGKTFMTELLQKERKVKLQPHSIKNHFDPSNVHIICDRVKKNE